MLSESTKRATPAVTFLCFFRGLQAGDRLASISVSKCMRFRVFEMRFVRSGLTDETSSLNSKERKGAKSPACGKRESLLRVVRKKNLVEKGGKDRYSTANRDRLWACGRSS